MQQKNTPARQTPFSPLFSGLLGIALLLPASFFMLALLIRVCFGSTTLYYSMAPSFLQSPFDLFALHKALEAPWPLAHHMTFAADVLYSIGHVCRQTGAQFIFSCLLLAILFNLFAILQFRMQRGIRGWEIQVYYRRYWLNTAIALQSGLLLLLLVAYTVIQHIRY